jgi:hypothetical protein
LLREILYNDSRWQNHGEKDIAKLVRGNWKGQYANFLGSAI